MNKSYWFEHDYNAANDAKILFLRQQLGMEGYGIYWFVVEQLVQAGGRLPLKVIPVLAMQSQTQESKVNAIITGYELFAIEQEHFFSIRLNRHIDVRSSFSEAGKVGAEKRWKNRGANRGAISGANGGVYAKTDRQTDNRIFGVEFFANDTKVRFSDGSEQPLGKGQKQLISEGSLKPQFVKKGIIE